MLILQKKFRSLRHLPYLWIVLGKNALHVIHPIVSPSLMFNMVLWGLYHMAKLVLHKVVLCTPNLVIKILKFGWRVARHVLKLKLKCCKRLLLPHQVLRVSYLQKISQLSFGDLDMWESMGHIMIFVHHVSYRTRYLWLNIEFMSIQVWWFMQRKL